MHVFKMFKYIELSVKCKIRSVIQFLNERNMLAIDIPNKFVKFMDQMTFHHSKKERKKHVEFRNKIILGCCVCFFLITKQPLLKKPPRVHSKSIYHEPFPLVATIESSKSPDSNSSTPKAFRMLSYHCFQQLNRPIHYTCISYRAVFHIGAP